jgi:enamine deaminase RidA (YjgF/YER057c/UK114 family)
MSVEKLLPSKYGYSNVAITEGRLAFVAGQIAEDEHWAFVGRDDFQAQTRQVFLNLKTILSRLNASPDDVIKLNYYIVGLAPERLAAVRAARDAMFESPRKPASTLIGVAALFKPEALIEVEMVVQQQTMPPAPSAELRSFPLSS